jgi:hypothetical protein
MAFFAASIAEARSSTLLCPLRSETEPEPKIVETISKIGTILEEEIRVKTLSHE